ncbi:MAG: phospho-N-acetylmuramoyl-pentapeptide-transferase [Butyrivibrio sp.]|jgi:phospho-N-acetylmuramoyl-pentapeptide-transferase|uniref:phospho-N-acetylmuramoyl-pentapeptide- transferase n=1 Tax=Butyrivibrio sp. TaxID=28121 RepID=UPI001ECAEAF4|nr:phospho-N-acetylmuramoyl-pentapeptide-transferase [Butyrivibrio sp.]MBE5841067.1 phospho-N-acetylmuramoyl-pentapeptide-transferase [Butyrivibrio sp.]
MNGYLLRTLIPVLGSFAASVLIGPSIIKMLRKLKAGQTEREEGLESHQKKTGTPTMGGIIFLIPFFVIGLCYGAFHKEVIPVLILTFGSGLIGFIDDYIKVVKKHNLGLRAWQKMAGQFLVTVIFAFYVEQFTDLSLAMKIPFTDKMVDFGFWNIPILFFITLGTVNGTNFTDGVDGLCASVTAVVAGFFAIAGMFYGATGAEVMSSAMMGALLGYLVYNVYPGKVMMGDTGSLAIGGFVTGIAYVMHMPIFIVIVGFIYAFEVISVILQVSFFKITHGKRIFRMAPIHHHFEKGGWSETKVVNVFTTVTLLLCLIAYMGL